MSDLLVPVLVFACFSFATMAGLLGYLIGYKVGFRKGAAYKRYRSDNENSNVS
ncbi:MAG: hypothetical protein H0Z39_06935 [Peptococcaceae bacterium]|nr:hypothetical protein [Peptococcaceae bacterium]